MKTVCVIPARYNSSRFPGKPLADICGKPMVWWVFNAVSASKISDVYIATDDKRIVRFCDAYNMPYIMTNEHEYGINRIQEVSDKIKADYYVQINGDEPLIEPNVINAILVDAITQTQECVYNLITRISNPVEAQCPTNIKIVFNGNKEALYASRTPIPNPYKSVNFSYYKHIGVLGFNKKALDFFRETSPGFLESIEGLEIMRFMEHNKKFKCIEVENAITLSVDTPKDLDRVREIVNLKKDVISL